jgi:4'-phosphopantetheinyl transferase EntD
VIDALLPSEVAVVETTTRLDRGRLLAEELAALGGASAGRTAEFATGRSCARLALRQLGVRDVPILRGSDREPLWPEGIVGSITHCAGYCSAAVAPARAISSIGIDAEPDLPLPDGILDRIALPDEQRWVTSHRGAHWDRLLFSAKESVFKTWFPVTRRWLEFEDARVTFLPAVGAFEAEVLVPPAPGEDATLRHLEGRFAVRQGLLLTAIALRAAQASPAWDTASMLLPSGSSTNAP